VSAPTPAPRRGEVLIERRWTGVNASDVNFTAGRYFGGAKKAAALLPFDAGFESVGVVAALGPGVAEAHPELAPGQPVATTTYGGFSEYAVAPAKLVVPVPEASPAAVALLTSGLTASIAMEQLGGVSAPASAGGRPTPPGRQKTVLVTAAAGGTGQIAVQLAKLAGHHVVATCGGEKKARMLAGLGVDRVVNYKKERLKEVLRSEYRRGVDLAYESVGGEMFETAVDALAPHGVLIVIGMMSQYTSGGDDASEAWTPSENKGLPEKLLWKSASVRGFFLPQYAKHFRRHLAGLFELVRSGKMRVEIDPTPFKGLEAVPRAVAHLQGGTSMGKVVVDVRPPAKTASRM
jgi:NADPH:quinone reductase-like Zn-dependent oxidoreductase